MAESEADSVSDNQEDQDEIKSNSLIKFQAIDQLPTFATLKCDVNLRHPPQNWLNGQIKNRSTTSSYNFSSFKMAFDFFDELQDVDVISDSENIKNLLKMAYNPSCVLSYFVHRVGNSILIDDFNLQRFFMWQSETEWKWLRSFLAEHIIGRMKTNSIPIQHKTKEFLEQKNLLSKFLYYSIEESKRTEEKEKEPLLSFHHALLPQPKREDIPAHHQYSRNVLWNFENIRMLIGSDMQIFGNQSRPCISLRLKDMSEPINVLTGIDYWLDNLMCNVPEIFMCYHLNGIVQKYELIKTEDLPSLENSAFSPKVIRNVAQNILSFLKQNATKSGHTYWLFKAKNDDVVKLYDLTTLQLLAEEKAKAKESAKEDKTEKDDKNPFTIPVAILLYTVARNLKYSNEKLSTRQAGNIKHLLDNCLKLLPREKYAQIITTSHYILSDIQIQAGTDPMNPVVPFSEDNDEDNEDEEQENNSEESDEDSEDLDLNLDDRECRPAVQSIKESLVESAKDKSQKPTHAPLVLGTIQERSFESLKNVVEGLRALKFLQSDASLEQERQKLKEQIIHEEQNPNLLQNPDIAIPMGWRRSSSTSRRNESPPTESESENVTLDSKSLLKGGSPNVNSWNIHLKVLLFEKASLAYACLTESFYNSKNYGAALRNLRFSLQCQGVVKKYVPAMKTQRSVLFGRCGDCFFQISKIYDKIDAYIEEFSDESVLDKEIAKELERENLSDDDEIVLLDEGDEKMLEMSCQCYELSLIDANQSKLEIVRRLGNVYNEVGVALMHKAQRQYNEHCESAESKANNEDNAINTTEMSYQQIAKSSYDNLMKAVVLFEGVNDSVNLIICHLNLGRFFRLSAHINMFHASSPLKAAAIRKKLYTQAFDSYNRALSLLGNRKSNHELYDHVYWELSTATFSLAKQMQDESVVSHSQEDLEREVLDMLMKALKLCDTETSSSRQELYIFRAGLVHLRIASLYHQQLRTMSDEGRRKTLLQLCRLNYEKSASLLASLNEFRDYFKVQAERVALNEFLADEATSVALKLKNLQFSLHIFGESRGALSALASAKSVVDGDEILALLELFEKRLQFTLKSLTKLALSAGKKSEQRAESFKKMFAATLRRNESLSLAALAEHLVKVLHNVSKLDYAN